MRHQAGLTVLEVVIALSILAVGVLAAAGLQASALRASRTAQSLQHINAAAQSQVNAWRGLKLTHTSPSTSTCTVDGLDCQVTVRPCAATSGGLVCDLSSVPQPVAHSVTVTVGNAERSLTLSTVVAR